MIYYAIMYYHIVCYIITLYYIVSHDIILGPRAFWRNPGIGVGISGGAGSKVRSQKPCAYDSKSGKMLYVVSY